VNDCVKILLIEDNPGDQRLVRIMLGEARHSKFAIKTARSISESQAILQSEDFDAVLLDLGLPDSQGLESLHRLKPFGKSIPIIIMTGNDSQELGWDSVKNGAQDYIVKGTVNSEALERVISYSVYRKQAEKTIAESAQSLMLAQKIGRLGNWEWNTKANKITWSDELYALYERDPAVGPPTPEEEAGYYGAEQAALWRTLAQESIQEIHEKQSDITVKLPSGKTAFYHIIMQPVRDDKGTVIALSGIVQDITERKVNELRTQLLTNVLDALNSPNNVSKLTRNIMLMLKDYMDIEAVGFRIKQGDDFPYYETNGFPPHFVETEKFLCSYDQDNAIARDRAGKPLLECMCGNVICGRTPATEPFFTRGGSFWTNSTTDLLASTTDKERQARTRNRCHGAGYESVALIPLKNGDQVIGLFQLNDERRNRFKLEDILFLEKIGASIGIAIRRRENSSDLQTAKTRFKELFDHMASGVAVYEASQNGEEFIIQDFNLAALKIDNLNPDDVIGKNVAEIFPGIKDFGLFSVIKNVWRTGKPEYLPATLYKDYRFSGWRDNYVYKLPSGEVVVIYNDLTEKIVAGEKQKLLENKAEVSSRLAAVGEMAAGIAHEINNPLTGVIGFSEILLERNDLPADVKEQLKIIADGSNRVKNIVRRMLTFARQNKPVKSKANINELIDNTLEIRGYVLKTSNIDVIKKYDLDLPWIPVDAGQMQQVFLNLIVNAEYSMKKAHDKGVLTITTEWEGSKIRLSFRDDGLGMSQESKAKLFHPFFTTKPVGEGTGLGLSLSHSIILEHGGTIEVDSEPGKGADFIITLPIITAVETPAGDVTGIITELTTGKTRCGRILVVDDEKAIRDLVSAILITNGHTIETTGDAGEVLSKLDNNRFDAILIDIRMPGMSGMELYTAIIEKHPEMKGKIIFITGDTSDANTRDFLEQNQLPYITKPFDKETLIKQVNNLL
jgi:signal transduction histidine kinase/DNA-binding response OmpR family regulator